MCKKLEFMLDFLLSGRILNYSYRKNRSRAFALVGFRCTIFYQGWSKKFGQTVSEVMFQSQFWCLFLIAELLIWGEEQELGVKMHQDFWWRALHHYSVTIISDSHVTKKLGSSFILFGVLIISLFLFISICLVVAMFHPVPCYYFYAKHLAISLFCQHFYQLFHICLWLACLVSLSFFPLPVYSSFYIVVVSYRILPLFCLSTCFIHYPAPSPFTSVSSYFHLKL